MGATDMTGRLENHHTLVQEFTLALNLVFGLKNTISYQVYHTTSEDMYLSVTSDREELSARLSLSEKKEVSCHVTIRVGDMAVTALETVPSEVASEKSYSFTDLIHKTSAQLRVQMADLTAAFDKAMEWERRGYHGE